MKRLAPLFLLTAALASTPPPDIYKRIGHLVWLVRDLNAAQHAWQTLGLTDVHDFGPIPFKGDYRGRPIKGRLHMATGRLGNLTVDMLTPPPGDTAFKAFASTHGDGIFALVHEATPAQLTAETDRLRAAGVQVLQRIQLDTGRGPAAFTFFDTEPQGKYVLGLVQSPPAAPAPAAAATISHIAFAIREAQPVSDYWQRLGFPAMPVSHASPRADSRYHGAPLLLSFDVGWHRYTHPTFEWIIPPQAPPNCYADFLKQHGEGVHHLGMPVEDLDKAIARYKDLGYTVLQSGAWGDVGKPNSGRYGYMSTDAIGGVIVELIHAYN